MPPLCRQAVRSKGDAAGSDSERVLFCGREGSERQALRS